MILVFGQSGQVARELACFDDVLCVGRKTCDLAQRGAARDAIAHHRPDAVINAAAFTAVDAAEDAPAEAQSLNADAVAEMAAACADAGIPLVQISTDYVFAGDGTDPWHPSDPTGPLGVYGRSKLAGEIAVRDSGASHAILRTSWVVSAHGHNFVKTMRRLGATRDTLTVVADQIGGPTAASDIAAACHSIAQQLMGDPAKSGTYHFAGAPDVSWADFARAVFAQDGISCTVTDIPTSAYPTPATRPLNSRMDCTTTTTTFAIPRPNWRISLTKILQQL